ncbi:unnamed protein product [Meganyctiphanes norvegica]|uniref:Uncharacterized protein n=1 Tax=Meganyctiphanes norvegica TaxID=48144 RepID=A0AAV2RQW8_MEGNR
MDPQNSFGKNKKSIILSTNPNKEPYSNTARFGKSLRGRSDVNSSYQTSQEFQRFYRKPNEQYSLKISHEPDMSTMKPKVSNTSFQSKRNLKPFLQNHNNKNKGIQKRQGLQSLFIKQNSSKTIDQGRQNRELPKSQTDRKSQIHINKDYRKVNRRIVNRRKKSERIGRHKVKSTSNSSTNMNSTVTDQSIRTFNKENDQKSLLKPIQFTEDKNETIENIKDERRRFPRRKGYGVQRKQKGNSFGYVIKEPGMHHEYSITYGE